MPKRKLLVKPTRVKATRYKVPAKTIIQHRGGKRITLHRPAQVITKEAYRRGGYRILDRGKPGRGPKLIPIRHPGFMTDFAMRRGYLKEGMGITDLSNEKIGQLARALARDVGAKKAFSMFQAQVNFRANARERDRIANRRKFEAGRDAIAKAYASELTPKAAIRANLKRGENPYGPG